MLDLEPLFVGINSIIESQVGDQLHQTQRDAAGTLGPAIFKDRQKQYKEYPYITVDLLSVKENGGWVENISVNDSDQTEYTFNYQALFLVSCFGKNSSQILSHFKQTLTFEGIRQALYENSGNMGTLQRSRDVNESPDFLETDYEDMASMELVINFHSTIADLSSTIIESVEIESNIKETEDSNPITTTFIVP